MRGAAFLVVATLFVAEAGAQPGAPKETVTPSDAVQDSVERLEALTAEIDVLTNDIADADSEVSLLKETALTGEVGRTHAAIVHRNSLGPGFKLASVRYRLDGEVLLDRGPDSDGPKLHETKALPLYSGFMTAGDHVIEVEATIRSGTFGIFTYAEGYAFKVQSRYVLRVREGRVNKLDVVFTQKEDISLAPEQRLTVRYDLDLAPGVSSDPSNAVAESRE